MCCCNCKRVVLTDVLKTDAPEPVDKTPEELAMQMAETLRSRT